ncbi:MAG: His/Gly/Thr/Pro-type tRNA ligase C-terminal domain-containing protein [bacterium]|nr:His/Gly/Thr/Pro-type tRNA ligase C-terminal domain-containing protein [bacterium]
MIRLKDTKHATTSSFLNDAIHIAEFYGFAPLDDMSRQSLNINRSKNRSRGDADIAFTRRDERTIPPGVRKCIACVPVKVSLENVQTREPLLAWRVSGGTSTMPTKGLELHVIGTSSAVAEALLIVVAHAIAEEAGIAQRVLCVNNIGSFESSNRYVRDVGVYLRKHIESISPTLRPRIVDDPLGTLVQLIEKGHPAVPRAPQAMEYLTEEERRRFWELLEYLEVFGLPYELNSQVLGSRDLWAHSLYEISSVDEETGARIAVAFGGRNDPLATRLAGRTTPAAMITISCEVRGGTRVKRAVRGIPGIYFAHLGSDARRRSLAVMESLRRATIPVHHGLCYDKIGDQMAAARILAVPYVLIMGHKEAMEGTILVREVATNSQEAVPVPELPNYLKRHRMSTWKIPEKA